MGGYSLPAGFAHLHQSSAGMASMTKGMWRPQPNQVAPALYLMSGSGRGEGERESSQQVEQLVFLHMLGGCGCIRMVGGGWEASGMAMLRPGKHGGLNAGGKRPV